MGGAEFRAGQPRPFGQVNLAPDFRAGGGSGGARGGEPTENVTGIHPESVSLGQEFQVFNPLSTYILPPARGRRAKFQPHAEYTSIKILNTNFSPPIPLEIFSHNPDGSIQPEMVLTPLNPGLGHQVNTKDFSLASRIEQYLQAPDFNESENFELAPLNFFVSSVDTVSQHIRQTQREYFLKVMKEFHAWFLHEPESRQLMQNLYFTLRSPSVKLASHPVKDIILEYPEHYSSPLWFNSFFPTDTGPLPYDFDEIVRRGKRRMTFEEGYQLNVPANLDALSLLKGSFNQLPG